MQGYQIEYHKTLIIENLWELQPLPHDMLHKKTLVRKGLNMISFYFIEFISFALWGIIYISHNILSGYGKIYTPLNHHWYQQIENLSEGLIWAM